MNYPAPRMKGGGAAPPSQMQAPPMQGPIAGAYNPQPPPFNSPITGQAPPMQDMRYRGGPSEMQFGVGNAIGRPAPANKIDQSSALAGLYEQARQQQQSAQNQVMPTEQPYQSAVMPPTPHPMKSAVMPPQQNIMPVSSAPIGAPPPMKAAVMPGYQNIAPVSATPIGAPAPDPYQAAPSLLPDYAQPNYNDLISRTQQQPSPMDAISAYSNQMQDHASGGLGIASQGLHNGMPRPGMPQGQAGGKGGAQKPQMGNQFEHSAYGGSGTGGGKGG